MVGGGFPNGGWVAARAKKPCERVDLHQRFGKLNLHGCGVRKLIGDFSQSIAYPGECHPAGLSLGIVRAARKRIAIALINPARRGTPVVLDPRFYVHIAVKGQARHLFASPSDAAHHPQITSAQSDASPFRRKFRAT